MAPARQNPWQKRVRRLLWFFSAASTIYLLSSYALDRLREARVRALKDKKQKDLIKSHFNSLLSTISFTLYALLPTLQPQIAEAYPVESTSRALQGLSASSSNVGGSVHHSSVEATPEHSVILERPQPAEASSAADDQASDKTRVTVGESWASELQQRPAGSHEDHAELSATESTMASSYGQMTDQSISPAPSAAISLPPTDSSSIAPSSPSDSSSPPLQRSPIRPAHLPSGNSNLQVPESELAGKSKKELWRDLKMQTLTRTLTTVYLLPLLHILTASQLSVLARIRYMKDVESSLPAVEPASTHSAPEPSRKSGIFPSLSITSLGLSDFFDSSTPPILPPLPNPFHLLPTAISTRLPSISFFRSALVASTSAAMPPALQDDAARAEDERTYLSYSWWILHRGWQDVAARVEAETHRIFGDVGLKRDLSIEDWEGLLKEVRAGVEAAEAEGTTGDRRLRDWTAELLPPSPLPADLRDCPLPSSTIDRPHLRSLVTETADHLRSPDFHYLLDRGVSTLVGRLVEQLQAELYTPVESDEDELPPSVRPPAATQTQRRLVDCLPAIDQWGKGVWEGVPDSGVESILALKEYESFAALIFGDWGSQQTDR